MHIGTPVARIEGARTAKRALGAQRVNTDRKLPPFHRLKADGRNCLRDHSCLPEAGCEPSTCPQKHRLAVWASDELNADREPGRPQTTGNGERRTPEQRPQTIETRSSGRVEALRRFTDCRRRHDHIGGPEQGLE